MTITEQQTAKLMELLWEYMKRDREHSDRVQTGWGTKTQAGLVACIERIMTEAEAPEGQCPECGHPYKQGDETHYSECSRMRI